MKKRFGIRNPIHSCYHTNCNNNIDNYNSDGCQADAKDTSPIVTDGKNNTKRINNTSADGDDLDGLTILICKFHAAYRQTIILSFAYEGEIETSEFE